MSLISGVLLAASRGGFLWLRNFRYYWCWWVDAAMKPVAEDAVGVGPGVIRRRPRVVRADRIYAAGKFEPAVRAEAAKLRIRRGYASLIVGHRGLMAAVERGRRPRAAPAVVGQLV